MSDTIRYRIMCESYHTCRRLAMLDGSHGNKFTTGGRQSVRLGGAL